jgi:hypothetical protein
MAEPSFADQIATLNSTLRAIEVRMALGPAPVEGLEDFKGALDDMRLRLWGLLGAAGGEDSRGFQERFRIRRAIEMCRSLAADLRSGTVSGRHQELASLKEASAELGQGIQRAQEHAF